MEQLLLIYRTIVTVPCWLLFYEGIGMGSLLTSLMRGAHPSHQQLPCLSTSLARQGMFPQCQQAASHALAVLIGLGMIHRRI